MSSIHLSPHAAAMPEPKVTEVSPGIFAYIQLDGSWGLNNPGFIVGMNSVVLIDSCFTEPRARRLRAAIEGVTDKPVRTLINTHHHGDHTWGNFVFPEATIIGHRLCREAVIQTGLSVQAFFPGVSWGDIQIAPPFVTFEDHLDVWVDDLKLEIYFVGPAHTTNDAIVWVPERKVLFAGDLVFNKCTPFVIQGSLIGHLRALETLRGLSAEIVVPGHGDICDPEGIEDCIAYLRFVQELARHGYNKGMTPLETARSADLGRFGEWPERERLVANLHRAYSEIRGEPLGVPLELQSVFEEMIIFNGGPVRCFA
ncbi:MAG: MBL fold metallo-hydrolase [Chloroflexota bacterium]